MTTILVTGGAGYIGSHTLKLLRQSGYGTACFDNLSTGFRRFAGSSPLFEGDLRDPEAVNACFSGRKVDAVIHFASHALVEESYRDPHKYYRDNITNCLNLLEAMRGHGVRHMVFSSSCATYGIPRQVPINESEPLLPVNPYGATKMVVERILGDYENAYGLRYASLRYFNAAGADPEGELGEWHEPETHLIPRLLDVARGANPVVEVYGKDYPTPDGTCIRDYVHVLDLARAHIAAIEHLMSGDRSEVLNLGTGKGCSVLEVIGQVEETTGRRLALEFKERRKGDPPALVADAGKARSVLGWAPEHSSIEEIVHTAWNWHQSRDTLFA